MAVKNYLINDKWLDIDKQNIVEVKSTDGVIGSVKVNGEEYGGSGGESDFSTAEVTIVNGGTNPDASEIEFIGLDLNDELGMIMPSEAGVYKSVLYKNKYVISTNTDTFVSCEGNATYETDEDVINITITGDCTITLKFAGII